MQKKIALIELNSYHDECLYSQLCFLKDSGYWICLIIHPKLVERIDAYKDLSDDIKILKCDSKVFFIKRLIRVLMIYRHITRLDIKKILFNTSSSKKEIILLSFLFRKKELFGIIHNLKKLEGSLSQKLINKNVKNYFVLNDFLLTKAQAIKNDLKFCSFYPIYFPKYKRVEILKAKNETWVTVPGKLDYARRDYDLVIKAVSKLEQNVRPKVIILGKIDSNVVEHKLFMNKIRDYGVQDSFVLFHNYVENRLFHSYLNMSDYILIPLKKVDDGYKENKIMGAYNLAFAYKKKLIAHKGLDHIDDIKKNALLYHAEEILIDILKDISFKNVSVSSTMYSEKKWEFEVQRDRYIKFIEIEENGFKN